MKAITILIAVLLVVRVACGDDITLNDGTVLKNAKIVQQDDSTKIVTISFSGGIAQVHSDMMPASLATVQPPAVTNAASQTTPVPEPSTPTPPSTPVPKDWSVDGRDYHNVTVTQVDADRVHITYDGGIGTVMLSDLPPDLQKRFSYDPVAANAAIDERAKQAAQSDAMVAAQMRQSAKNDAAQANAQPHVYAVGKVVQVLPEGLLVSCPAEEPVGGVWDNAHGFTEATGNATTGVTGVNIEVPTRGTTFLLKHYPKEDSVVEGDRVGVVAYRSGRFSYTTTSGGQATIASYTAVPQGQ